MNTIKEYAAMKPWKLTFEDFTKTSCEFDLRFRHKTFDELSVSFELEGFDNTYCVVILKLKEELSSDNGRRKFLNTFFRNDTVAEFYPYVESYYVEAYTYKNGKRTDYITKNECLADPCSHPSTPFNGHITHYWEMGINKSIATEFANELD